MFALAALLFSLLSQLAQNKREKGGIVSPHNYSRWLLENLNKVMHMKVCIMCLNLVSTQSRAATPFSFPSAHSTAPPPQAPESSGRH